MDINPTDILRWTRLGPRDNRGNFVLILDGALVATASGLSSTIFDHNAIYAGGNGQAVWKSIDNGVTWMKVDSGMTSSFSPHYLAMCWMDSSKLYAADMLGTIYHSADSAFSWRSVGTSGIPGPKAIRALAVHPNNPRYVYVGVVGSSGSSGIYRTTDGGISWTACGIGLPTQHVNAIAIAPSEPILMYAALRTNNQEEGRGLYRSWTGGAASWLYGSNGLPNNADISSIVVSPQNPSLVYVGLTNNAANGQHHVYRSDDGGESWRQASAGIPANALILQLALSPIDSETIYAAAHLDGVYKSTNGGRLWHKIDSGLPDPSQIGSIAVDYSGNYVHAGARGVWNWQEGSETPIDPPVVFDPVPAAVCPPAITPADATAPRGGLTSSVEVITTPTCVWKVESTEPSWLRIDSVYASNGQSELGYHGSGRVNYTVLENPEPEVRTAWIRIGNRNFEMFQDAGRLPSNRIAITGRITDRTGAPMPGVRVLLRHSRRAVAITDRNGRYRFGGLPAADFYDYLVVPHKANVNFNPPSDRFFNPTTDKIADFSAPAYEQPRCKFRLSRTFWEALWEFNPPQAPIGINAERGCRFTPVKDADWIIIRRYGMEDTGVGGEAEGYLECVVEDNPSPDERIGTISIGDSVFTIKQGGRPST